MRHLKSISQFITICQNTQKSICYNYNDWLNLSETATRCIIRRVHFNSAYYIEYKSSSITPKEFSHQYQPWEDLF